jgi:dihydroorotate dehydrogenase (fumarate)
MNLATSYLGLNLANPFIIGSSPFCDSTFVARRLQDAGAAAVVMRSLFQEQIDFPVRSGPAAMFDDSDGVVPFPEFADYQFSPTQYLQQLENLKANLAIPVIASLNGHCPGSWIDFARGLENAGADAIEVNFYRVVTTANTAADQVETEMLETVGTIAGAVSIPVAVKLSPYHTSVAQLAVALELAGAAGIVVFNRFYQPDVNTDTLTVKPLLRLSTSSELLLRLRWLAILSPQLRASLAVSGGVHNSSDVVKSLLTGANAVQVVSALLRRGPGMLRSLRSGLEDWMHEHDYTELEQFRGLLNLRQCPDPGAFERANYIRTLQSWQT